MWLETQPLNRGLGNELHAWRSANHPLNRYDFGQQFMLRSA